MLRSIARHFNESVFRGPDMEGGTDVGGGDTGGAPLDGGINDDAGGDPSERDSPDSGHQDDKTLTLREQLKKSIAEVSADDTSKPKRETKKAATAKTEASAATDATPAPVAEPAIAAPDSLSKEAKEAWKDVPPAVQQAFVKREQDMQRGVDELKNRYALIDQAIAPHQDALRQMNATPQQAVDRMFLWFKALAANPAAAYPQLAQSMGMDWNKIVAHIQGQQNQGQPPAQQTAPQVDANGQPVPGAPEIPEGVRNYVGQLENNVRSLTQQIQQRFQQIDGRVESFEQTAQRENMNRTTENLNQWAKDKPYFEEVRQEMASLLQSGMIALKDGNVDLDTAYERAIHFKPEVRAKVLAAQQEANRAVQTQATTAATTAVANKTNQARKAASSLPANNPPGTTVQGVVNKRKPGQKMSVRDSLTAAIGQLRDQ